MNALSPAVILSPTMASLFPIPLDRLLRTFRVQLDTVPADQMTVLLDELQEMLEEDGASANPALESLMRRHFHTRRSTTPGDHLDALLARYEPEDGPDYDADYEERQINCARWEAWRDECAAQAQAEWRRDMRAMLDALIAAMGGVG